MLVDWANAQDHWVRSVVAELLATGKPLPDDRIRYHFECLLREKQLLDGEVAECPPLGSLASVPGQVQSLVLTRLGDVCGVNALAPDQEIAFNQRLTVLFGENATGKTGYVRILKAVARVRNTEKILPNIEPGAQREAPHASISYQLGGVASTLEWKGEEGLVPLTQLDVFDSRGTAVHVDQDLTFTYTPRELALFQNVYQSIEAIKARLDAARKERTSSGNPFIARFVRGTAVYPKVESLGASTDLSELENLARVTDEAAASVATLTERVESLKPEGANQKVRLAASEKDLFARLRATVEPLAAFDRVAHGVALTSLAAARKREREFSEQAFAADQIPEIFSEPWRTLLAAAEDYSSHAVHAEYPKEGEPCLYCRQPLNLQAVELLNRYRVVLLGDLARECKRHEDQLALIAKDVLRQDFGAAEADLRSRLSIETDPERQRYTAACLAVVAKAAAFQTALRAKSATIDEEYIAEAQRVRDWLDARERESSDLLQTMTAEAGERKLAYEQETAKLRNLEAQLTLRELLPAIRTFVENAKWADKAGILLRRFVQLSKSITEASKTASESLLNRDFEARFEIERVKLAAPAVKLDFPGSKGQPARRKALSADYRLSDTLSEGEQKVIALADFLAEVGMSGAAAPIVFDDPVNSLDYKRLEYVVRRVVEISASRQVIVFTHNIWFAAELLARFEESAQRKNCSYFDISADQRGRGLVSLSNNPRTDSFGSMKAQINTLAADAAKLSGTTQTAVIEKAYEVLRGLIEVIVEADLLQGVTRRYQPNVMIGGLSKIKADRLGAAVQVLQPMFEKCCRVISSHSQPLETLNVRPSLAELQKDWQDVQAARDAYRKEDKV